MILKNKTALITGGSRGIGKTVAAAYIREGAAVMLAARSQEELSQTREELSKSGAQVEIFQCDIAEREKIGELAKAAERLLGRVDILVNAAGIYGPIGPSVYVDYKKWVYTYEVNVFGTFSVIQAIVPSMLKAGHGKVINFSGGGDGPLPRFSAYNSSKGAIVRLTETLAEEWKKNHVDINALAPGAVNTHFLDEALAAGEDLVGKEKYQALISQKEKGGVPPETTAELCVFLASPASDGLSGKFLSAVWDPWKKWNREKIDEVMKNDKYTLRRVV